MIRLPAQGLSLAGRLLNASATDATNDDDASQHEQTIPLAYGADRHGRLHNSGSNGLRAQPGYIDVNIPVARHQGGGAFWWERQRSALAYSDSDGVLYLTRYVGTAYPDSHDWKTATAAIAYFDEKLRAQGWQAADEAMTGNPALPESRFLPLDNLRRYVRNGGSRHAPELYLAIWPGNGDVKRLQVAVTTANTSLLRRLSQEFDWSVHLIFVLSHIV